MGTIQNLIVLAMIAISVGSAIYGKLREVRERRKLQERLRRQREEELRTGRPAAPAPAPTAAAPSSRHSELAARRQAQLEELRRRQQQPIVVPPTAGPRPVPIPGQRAPTPVRPAPSHGRSAGGPSAPVRVPVLVRPPEPPKPREPRAGRPGAVKPVERRTAAAIEPAAPTGRDGESPEPPRAQALVRASREPEPKTAAGFRPVGGARSLFFNPDGSARSGAELARLIVVNEILSPPLSLRNAGALPWERA